MYTLEELQEVIKPLSLGELADIRDGFNLVAKAMPILKSQPYYDRAVLAQKVMTKKVEDANEPNI